ncbi:glycine cleavage system aminomethyltransferase GcvT [Synechococcus sp. Nb3U1]|uniref:glycine cleavage system aminomethyltransferase GcvT n=1 Tax=Synechococcus sp. Nb3U1 TaxID=1914529 RepID=UPI001EFFC418|nr:glycine cleavage system aminomethyltransferase GcvT [Synechococcus sp. Nb3U1]MCF2970987.1 glycine cleavage system aminomethyltransferase GcvT [Synechococcus sp. Nb3U1]
MSPTLQRTPLFAHHQALGARFVPFSGWEMPVQYQGVVAEHQAVREKVGVFDISHMGKFTLWGPELGSHLNRLLPTDLSPLPVGCGRYTVLLNPQGGILDDVIVYKHPPEGEVEHWSVIVNAATCQKDWDWLHQHLSGIPGVQLRDYSSAQVLLAVQGREAEATLQPFLQGSLAGLGRFQHGQFTGGEGFSGEAIFVARTGYTGEDGFEVMLSLGDGIRLWEHLIQAGVQPCGLGCRDSLRLEAALHLYGQDMDETTTPLEAGLTWLVNNPGDYIGKAALETQRNQGIPRRLVGFRLLERAIPRTGYAIWAAGSSDPIGRVTSGTHSPSLGYGIGLGYVDPDWAKVGSRLEIEIRGQRWPAEVVKRPFYRTQA